MFIGSPSDYAVAGLKSFGAEKIYIVSADDDSAFTSYLVAPKAEALAQLVERTSPGAVLVSSSAEGKEVAARLAVKTESGLVTDAVDVVAGDGDPVTTQSVFADSHTVTAKVTRGTPIITVKPNAATPEPADGAGAVEQVAVRISEAAVDPGRRRTAAVGADPRIPALPIHWSPHR